MIAFRLNKSFQFHLMIKNYKNDPVIQFSRKLALYFKLWLIRNWFLSSHENTCMLSRVAVKKGDCRNISRFVVSSAIHWLWDGQVVLLLCCYWNKTTKDWLTGSLFGVFSEHSQISGHLRTTCAYSFLIYMAIMTDNHPMNK